MSVAKTIKSNLSLYEVKKIKSGTELILKTPYDGAIGTGFSVEKNNSNGKAISVFFGSKRVFLPIEITYLSAPN